MTKSLSLFPCQLHLLKEVGACELAREQKGN